MKRISILIIALLLLACQPTPDREAVVNKDDNITENAIKSTAAPEGSYGIPERWTETVALTDDLTLEIDVPVETGEGDVHPAYIVSQKRMDVESLKRFVLAVYPDVESVRSPRETLAELEEDIRRIQLGDYMGEENGRPVFEPYEEDLNALVEPIMEKIRTLPAEETDRPLAPGYLVLQQNAIPLKRSDESVVWLSGSDSGAYTAVFLRTERKASVQKALWIEQERGDLPGGPGPVEPGIAQADAEAQAEAVLARFGRTDFALASSEPARSVSTSASFGEILSSGWILTYTPTVPGTVACNREAIGTGELRLSDETFEKSWPQERISFYISDRGVEEASYTDPYEIAKTANENVALQPFSMIQEHIRSMMKYGFAWTAAYDPDDAGIGRRILVTRVALTSAVVPKKDDPDYALLIPAWAVYYTTEFGQAHAADGSVLLFNAIDGSIIDPQKGY